MANKANETKTNEAAETKKVTKREIIIPFNEKDPDTFVPVVINGKITTITKGVPVEVDNEVYNILLRAGYLGTIAPKAKKATKKDDEEE